MSVYGGNNFKKARPMILATPGAVYFSTIMVRETNISLRKIWLARGDFYSHLSNILEFWYPSDHTAHLPAQNYSLHRSCPRPSVSDTPPSQLRRRLKETVC